MATIGRSVLVVCQSNALRDEIRARLREAPNADIYAFQELCGHLNFDVSAFENAFQVRISAPKAWVCQPKARS